MTIKANWKNLEITDEDGRSCGTLGEMIERNDASLAYIEMNSEGIQTWEYRFFDIPGDESHDPSIDDIDWAGFEIELRKSLYALGIDGEEIDAACEYSYSS